MRPWSRATRSSASGWCPNSSPTGPARMALPLPADGAGVPAWSQAVPDHSRAAAALVAWPWPTTRPWANRVAMRPA